MSFEVRVVNDDGEGVPGVRVVLSFTDVMRGQTDAESTDSEGCAQFDGYDDGEVKVFLDGDGYGVFSYRDGDSITVTR